ncbi:MAG TPA: hypothetical protein VHY32_04745 [Caulobacteraceae bacterium]|jgi:hypothetical protein|nr:hypothetical protein [Caulobacteraceae bacterium]
MMRLDNDHHGTQMPLVSAVHTITVILCNLKLLPQTADRPDVAQLQGGVKRMRNVKGGMQVCKISFALLLTACARHHPPCVPTSVLRVELDGVAYAIPSELQPNLDVVSDKKTTAVGPFPGVVGAPKFRYCQKSSDKAWQVTRIAFDGSALKNYADVMQKLGPMEHVKHLVINEYASVSRTPFPDSHPDSSGKYIQYDVTDFSEYLSIGRPVLGADVLIFCTNSFPDRMPCQVNADVPGKGEVGFDIDRKVFLEHKEGRVFSSVGVMLNNLTNP